jgi:hypothetical protein
MSLSPLTLDATQAAVADRAVGTANSEHEQQVAKLMKALYPADRQEKFLELQAEVDTLLCQLQALQRVRA